jgi:hypothetical protein
LSGSESFKPPALPVVHDTDQGCQFTSEEWRKALETTGIVISMDGRGRWINNVMIERFWRSIKYEDIYLKSYENGLELEKGIHAYITRYNHHRPHVSLADATPAEIYSEKVTLDNKRNYATQLNCSGRWFKNRDHFCRATLRFSLIMERK